MEAKDILRDQLEDIFGKTSADCHDKIAAGFPNLPFASDQDDEGEPVDRARDAISLWREKSRECITAGFHQLLKVILDLRQGTGDNQADIAKDLAWQVVDQVFNWTAEDKSESSRFEQWKTRAGIWDLWAYDLVMVSPECNELGSFADRLNCDFRTQFERLLNQLRNEAFLNTPDGKGPAQKPPEQGLASNLLRFNGNLWTVRFGGSEGPIEDFVGVQYIAMVLQQKLAGKPDLKPTELAYRRYGPEAQPEKGQFEEAELGETQPEFESRDEVLPRERIGLIRKALAEVKAKLHRSNDPSEMNDLLDQEKQLEKYLANGRIKHPGADRTFRQAIFPGQSKKAQNSVRKAIKEAIEKMAADKALAPLAAHLDANIKYGTTVYYVGSIVWTVEPGVFPRKKS